MHNPLLEYEIRDCQSYIPFDLIKTEHFIPALTVVLDEARQELNKVRISEEVPSFENTILALDFIREKLEFISNLYYILLKAESDTQFRLISEKVLPMLREFNISILTDEALFVKVAKVYDRECVQKDKPQPDFHDARQMELCERYRYTEKVYKNFQRNGANLSRDDKQLLKEIDKELSALGPRFSNNLAAAISSYELHLTESAEVEGIPEWLLREAGRLATKKGKEKGWIFTLQTSVLLTVLNNCKNTKTREKLQKAFASKAYNDDFDNQNIVRRILSLRKQRARLLGYQNHVQYVLEERMLTEVSAVNEFLDHIYRLVLPAAKQEYQEVMDYAKETDSVTDFMFWDFNYYSTKMRESRFRVSQEELRPWFSLERVLDGFYTLADKIFGLKFIQVSHPPVYHKDVITYEVFDYSRKYIGMLYLDLFARESKRAGAWTNEFITQGLHKDGMKRPIVISAINLIPSGPDEPMLLSLAEVRTLYNEFGHALHILLSDCNYAELSGNNVLRDFLEVPSQLLTRWIYEKEFLDIFARHYQTAEPLSAKLLEATVTEEEYLKNIEVIGFLRFSALDLALHMANHQQLENLNEFENRVIEPYRLALASSDDSNITCQFGHIFSGGYAGSFYTYLWSKSLVADIWAFLKSKGIFNTGVTFALKDIILSKGNSVHPMELFMAFRGQKPDPEAMLR